MKTTESKERITTVSKKAIMYDTIYFFIGTDSKKDENIKITLLEKIKEVFPDFDSIFSIIKIALKILLISIII